ncbi:MAG TPA: hypothetical protein VGG37_03945, partial [Opitutaceae bacterium]
FLQDAARQVGPDDADDEGMKVFHELPRSNLIPYANAIKTAGQIKRLVVSHITIDASSGIHCKTPVTRGRLRLDPAVFLDFSSGQPINAARDGTRLPGPSTYVRARPLMDAA